MSLLCSRARAEFLKSQLMANYSGPVRIWGDFLRLPKSKDCYGIRLHLIVIWVTSIKKQAERLTNMVCHAVAIILLYICHVSVT